MDLLTSIDESNGYYCEYQMSDEELDLFRKSVEKHFWEVVKQFDENLAEQLSGQSLLNYHIWSSLLPHSSIWTKSNRLISPKNLDILKQSPFFEFLNNCLGTFSITGEEGIYHEEVCWRIARPFSPEDVGPLHADSWFWQLSNVTISKHLRRIKVWIPLYNEQGVNGLQIIAGSHKNKDAYKYTSVQKHLKTKPEISNDYKHLASVYKGQAGCPIIFHDDLVHGGIVGGSTTRVSMEFTILCATNQDVDT